MTEQVSECWKILACVRDHRVCLLSGGKDVWNLRYGADTDRNIASVSDVDSLSRPVYGGDAKLVHLVVLNNWLDAENADGVLDHVTQSISSPREVCCPLSA